jgi:hypothetical protein
MILSLSLEHGRYLRPEYNPESKVSNTSKKSWSTRASAALSLLPLKATIGGSGSRTGEQSTNVERTTNISRIIFTNMRGLTRWIYHLIDRFEQNSGLVLSPATLPFARIMFFGHNANPPPPSAYLNVEISTYWTVIPPPGGILWGGLSSSGNKPRFSNLCKIITLDLPKDLQGSHRYMVNLTVQLDTDSIISTVKNEVQSNLGLGKTIVAETNHSNADTSN